MAAMVFLTWWMWSPHTHGDVPNMAAMTHDPSMAAMTPHPNDSTPQHGSHDPNMAGMTLHPNMAAMTQ